MRNGILRWLAIIVGVEMVWNLGVAFVLSHSPSVSCVFPTRVQQICLCIALEQQRFQTVFWFSVGNTDCVSLLHMVALTLAFGELEFDGRVLPH